MITLKNTETYFDFPEDILNKAYLPPHEDFQDNPIFLDIYNALHLNGSNQILLFNGLPRTGKSEACLDFAYYLDRDPITGEFRFDIKNMSYTLKDYMDLITSNNTVGQGLIWEEAGLAEFGANSRDFFSKENKDASSIFQSMGFKRHLNLVNLPMKTMLDKQIRSLTHWVITTERINASGYCIAKMYKNDLKTIKDEVWAKKYKFADKHGVIRKVSTVKIPRAPRNLRTEYKHVSNEFKQKVQDMIRSRDDEWKRLPYCNEDRSIDKKKLYCFLQENMHDYIDLKKKQVDIMSFLVKQNLPDDFKRKVGTVLGVFNTELKNDYIQFNDKTKEAIAKYEETHPRQKTIIKEVRKARAWRSHNEIL